ncbi:MAG TPA: hypothetical protein VGM30_01945 [Puia sp.]
MQVDLCADIQMIDDKTFLVRNIRRVNMEESSLLPVLTLIYAEDCWLHSNTGKQSNISKTLGAAITKHLSQRYKSSDELKDNI